MASAHPGNGAPIGRRDPGNGAKSLFSGSGSRSNRSSEDAHKGSADSKVSSGQSGGTDFNGSGSRINDHQDSSSIGHSQNESESAVKKGIRQW